MPSLLPLTWRAIARALRSLLTTRSKTPVPIAAPPPTQRVALLIDGENTSASFAEQVVKIARQQGILCERRVFANWALPSYQNWIEPIARYDLRPIHHERVSTGKNAIDILITVEAMDLLFQGRIDCFCIAASDSDYTPLIKRLRAAGIKVVVIGNGNTPGALKAAASHFVLLEKVGPGQSESSPQESPLARSDASEPKLTQPHQDGSMMQPLTHAQTASIIARSPASTMPEALPTNDQLLQVAACWLVRAIDAAPKRDGDWVSAGLLGQSLRQIDPAFKPGQFGYGSLAKLVRACCAQYPEVFALREQTNGQVDVRLVRTFPPDTLAGHRRDDAAQPQ
ncbi:NYN domain-containing protein [Chloroflexus sp.]|uniref:NYN domain-containing protein n=1 Tax=Chloroflexus sp. TaxID=1904827 RepID=UPI00263430B0|nr:NYN domain-containing protein [uncultured Chloroflexus sp.]